MMGIFAPVVTEVCLTNPWTGLFSGEDLSIPGGVKPKRMDTHTHNMKHKVHLLIQYSILHQGLCVCGGGLGSPTSHHTRKSIKLLSATLLYS